MPLPAVRRTLEFSRIEALPREPQGPAREARADADAARLTALYARPGSGASLRRWQGYSLATAARVRGLFAGLPVGLGKTLVCELLPRVCWPDAPEGQTPTALLYVPSAGLRDKTFSDRRGINTKWRISDPPPVVMTLQAAATEGNANHLWDPNDPTEGLRPAIVIIDEADDAANADASAMQRLWRYVAAVRAGKVRPKGLPPGAPAEVIVCWLGGTPSRNTIMAYHHQLTMALSDGSPLPRDREEALIWGMAIDNKGPRGAITARPSPGPLGPNVVAARQWYLKRLIETPGVVLVDEDSAAEIPLIIDQILPRECEQIDQVFEVFATTGQSPGGIPIADPLGKFRFEGQAGCGFHTKYKDPQPPTPWIMARRRSARFCMSAIESSHARGYRGEPLDTEAQVVRAFGPNSMFPADEICEWLEIAPTYIPIEECVWFSDATILSARDWVGTLEPHEAAIVWCGAVELGHRVADALKAPYYGREGKERKTKRPLHAAAPFMQLAPPRGAGGQSFGPVPTADRVIVLSWQANKKGFNLQPYTRQLVVLPPPSAKWLEQMFGRSHRAGQLEPVQCSILMTSGAVFDMFDSAISEAQFARDTVGLTQKILRAAIGRVDPPVTHEQALAMLKATGDVPRSAFRWARH